MAGRPGRPATAIANRNIAMPAIVSLIHLNAYDDDTVVLAALRQALEPFGGMGGVVRPGQKVLLKPNLVAPSHPDLAVTTHPAILRGVIRLVREAGGTALVGDGPGVGDTRSAARGSGLLDVIEAEGATLADFDSTEVYENQDNRIARRLRLTSQLRQADVLITLPKLKTHAQMAYTGALKNQFGLIPGSAKGQFHFRLQNRDRLADLMIDINRLARPALAIMDAVVAMEGPGPSGGTPRHLGALVAGLDLAAVDTVCCAMIGLPVKDVPIAMAAQRARYGVVDLADITIAGARLDDFRQHDFELVKAPCNIMRILPLPGAMLRWLRRQLVPRPEINGDRCIRCRRCEYGCPIQPPAILPLAEPDRQVNEKTCIRCYCCHEFCPVKAIDLKRSRLDRVFHLNAVANAGSRLLGKLVSRCDFRRWFRPRTKPLDGSK